MNLVLNGTVVEGRTAGSNELVFTLSVDASGNVTLDQIRAVVHPTNDPNEPKTLSADNLVTLTAIITDKDGDSASATQTIGQNLVFQDDGPTISAPTSILSLTVDETNLAGNATQSFAAAFTSSYGADGAGTITYALGVVAGPSGLFDTASGQAVNLVLNGTVVEGRTAGSNELVFTLSVDASGNVTLDQIRAVVHPTNDPNEPKTLSADNLVTLTAIITDKDGDSASATQTIGQNLVFQDDGPTISAPTSILSLTVDETNLAGNATQSFAAAFTSSYGADGAGTITYALGVVAGPSGLFDTASGQAVNLVLNGTVVEGRTAGSNELVFTLSVDASGNVTLDQIRAVVHPTNDPNEPKTLSADNLVTLTAIITDKDGDSASATQTIGQNLVFQDDGPTISAPTSILSLTVDETNLAGNATQSFAAAFTSSYGADGAGTITYALGVVAGPSGLFDTASGQAVNLVLNGTVVEGRTAGSNELVFTLSVDASGNVTLDQIRAVVHPTNDPNEPKTLSADNLVTLTAIITDKDGDSASATQTIGQNLVFQDDGPIAQEGPVMTVPETAGPTGGTNLLANNSLGADGGRLTAVNFGLGAGLQAIAAVGTTTITNANGTYTFQANGTWTFDPVVNPAAPTRPPNFTYQITDGDGDQPLRSRRSTVTNVTMT